jgi:CO/xanthine dehydrogenase Mo-binding subunit
MKLTVTDSRSGTSRRDFLTGGTLVVAFLLLPKHGAAGALTEPSPSAGASVPEDLADQPWLDAWIRVGPDGAVTVFSGKVELGQGIRTALIQVAAEELDLPPARIELITADTTRTPNEGSTTGSHSMQDSGSAILNAAANVRLLLTEAAARHWHVEPATLQTTGDGHIRAADGQALSYGTLAASLSLHVQARANVPLRRPEQFRTLGRSLPRVDIPAKLSGGRAYVQDLRLPGMWHARVLRGPSYGTRLQPLDPRTRTQIPTDVKLVERDAFAAIVAEREWSLVQTLPRLLARGYVRTAPPLPEAPVVELLKSLPARDITILNARGPSSSASVAHAVSARYTRPWLCHASIGPSCAVALLDGGLLTVWTHSQGVFNLRRALADLLRLPVAQVRCIHVEGSGCYGHNGADDVAADAAVVAQALPGRPIRLQWMREQEFGWEPLGPAMLAQMSATLDAQHRIISWHHEFWSNEHNARPFSGGGLLAGAELQPSLPLPPSRPIPMPDGGASRNSDPIYSLPDVSVTYHFIERPVLRVSALRSLGAHFNVFCVESLLDELARAGSIDPLTLRLGHLQDERARTVLQTAAQAFGWPTRARSDGRRGCGMGFARYKNSASYCAVLMQIEVDRSSGRIHVQRVVAAVDSGQIANPDGLRNQIEGGIVQSLSWTTFEALSFNANGRTASNWDSYPILRFADVPDSVQVHLVDRPGEAFLGAGEAAQGPAAAALANALADATGLRVRDLPLSPRRLQAALRDGA